MKNRSLHSRLRIALATVGITQVELARRLSVPPTTLNGWLRTVHPAPAGLQQRIEVALGLPDGSLNPDRGAP